MRRSVKVILALIAGGAAGLAAGSLVRSEPTLPGPIYQVDSIIAGDDAYEVVLDRGPRFRVDIRNDSINARNIIFLHAGKQVALAREGAGRRAGERCDWIVPLLEQHPDPRVEDLYSLVRAGEAGRPRLTAGSPGPGDGTRPDYLQRSICAVRR